MSINRNNRPLITPAIIILSYTAESDVVYAPDHKHDESRHRRILQCFNTGDVLKARNKAPRCFQKEVDRFAEINKKFPIDSSPFRGLKLFFEYSLNEIKLFKKENVYRFYIFDGQDVGQSEVLERMEQELMFLRDAGVELLQAEVDGQSISFLSHIALSK